MSELIIREELDGTRVDDELLGEPGLTVEYSPAGPFGWYKRTGQTDARDRAIFKREVKPWEVHHEAAIRPPYAGD